MSKNPYIGIPNYEDVYGGQYFSPADLHEGRVTAKIVDLKYDEIFCKGAGKNSKIILTLEGQKKRVVVNKTSAKALAFAWGKDFAAWVGKVVSADGGEVNGKAAVLLRPVKGAAPGSAEAITPQAASDKSAWRAVQTACGDDPEQSKELWGKLKTQHGSNWQAIIDACACPA